MQALLASLIAVAGTLLGSTTSFLFQRRAADRVEEFSRAERLRQERLTASSAYAGAITELKRGVVSLWFHRQDDPDGAAYQIARAECDRLGAAAEHAQFRMRLISEDADLAILADAAFAAAGSIERAADRGQLVERETHCLEALNAFIAGAAVQLR
jgi:MoxR-like ATPase